VIRSCIFVFYIALSVSNGPASFVVARALQDNPDELYRDRATLASAMRAADVWSARLAINPTDFESAWKLAKAQYWLGTNGLPERDRKRALELGVTAARQAVAANAARPEGHFWVAANMGALAESFGLRQGIRYRGAIRQSLETVLRIDPQFQQGSADRALGRWYYKVPGLFGGDNRKSEAHLRKALAYNPQSVITLLFLGETLLDLGQRMEAKRSLEAAIAAPDDPEWAPEDRAFREQARRLLETLK
jgi:tetratricopeptide (TPR) repeat protein